MIRVLGLTAILLLCLAAMASANVTNWTLGILGSADGYGADRWNVIGTWSQYTDGLNSNAITFGSKPPGAEGSAPPTSPGDWIAIRQQTNPPGTTDIRAPFSSTVPESKTWTMNIYYYQVLRTDPVPALITVTIKPDVDKMGATISGTNGDLPDSTAGGLKFEYTFQLNGGPVSTYHALDVPASGLTYVISAPHEAATPDVLTVVVRTVPEPGSLLALGSGLAGFATFRRFRRK